MLIRCIYVVEVDFICIFIRQILKLYSYGSFLNIIPPYFFIFFQVKEHVNSSVSKPPSSPYFTKPSLWLYCNMLQLISFCTQVSLFMLCLQSALLHGCLACTALPSLWQRSVSARSWADVMLLQPCRHTSRRADGQTDRQNQRAGTVYL